MIPMTPTNVTEISYVIIRYISGISHIHVLVSWYWYLQNSVKHDSKLHSLNRGSYRSEM